MSHRTCDHIRTWLHTHTHTVLYLWDALYIYIYTHTHRYIYIYKGKGVPLQAWSGPEGSRKLRWMVVRLSALAPAAFTPRKCSWYSFLLEAESTPEP